MEKKQIPPAVHLKNAEEQRKHAAQLSQAALTTALGYQDPVFRAAALMNKMADSSSRKAKDATPEPSVAVIPPDATLEEVRKARRRQAIRRGKDTFLPSWNALAMALPNSFLRSALFSTGRSVQTNGAKVLAGDQSILVAGREIAAFKSVTLTFSGYELCQFDRYVYAACLNYYRETPLAPEDSNQYVTTSFYEFAKRMGLTYGLNPHKAILTSLLRLSFAQIRFRYNGWNVEVPKLLTASFEDGLISGAFKGSDRLLFRVTESIAELFGPGAWTAVDKEVVGYDGLMGWIASYYAGHSAAMWLDVEWLYERSGYVSHLRNFKKSLIGALEKLKVEQTPACSRVSAYHFTDDGLKLMVVRTTWSKTGLIK
ncbi:plasmid replication initiator TrfA [Massilia sp. TWR1-2-2]|uniref:plasmid replication initiator TrfA n=1 Tax=Massilia sp. TWR1-2-2 TaxID=2804584 RepID=UPI003CF6BEAC